MQRTIRQPRAMPLGAAALLAAARQYNARPNDSPPRFFLPILPRLPALCPHSTPDLAPRAWFIPGLARGCRGRSYGRGLGPFLPPSIRVQVEGAIPINDMILR